MSGRGRGQHQYRQNSTRAATIANVFQSEGSIIAEEAIKRIAGLYAVEKKGRGQSPDGRVQIRKEQAKEQHRANQQNNVIRRSQ